MSQEYSRPMSTKLPSLQSSLQAEDTSTFTNLHKDVEEEGVLPLPQSSTWEDAEDECDPCAVAEVAPTQLCRLRINSHSEVLKTADREHKQRQPGHALDVYSCCT
ncbi:unnamed protein product [Symbiodinium sp. CCMP2456]|nr:unnamed protein product [Symbiodinium sp. CCMP2456]